MRSILWHGLGCLGLALLLGAGGARGADEDLERLRNRIQEIGNEIQNSEARRDALTLELKESEQRIGQLTRHLKESEQAVAELQRNISELQPRLARARKQVAAARAGLAAHLRSAYLLGRQERLRLLLKEDNPAMVSRLIVYYDYITGARGRQVVELQQSIETMQREQEADKAAQQKMRETRASAAEEKRRLEKAQRVREELIAALGKEIAGKDVQLRRLKEDRERLEKLLASLVAGPVTPLPVPTEETGAAEAPAAPAPVAVATEGGEPFGRRKGKIAWPAEGGLAARFGERRASGITWDGVMIAATEGTLVRAVHPGTVVFADWMRGFGLLLILDHGDGYMSLYGYNQGLLKEVGAQVGAGEALGVVGRSGGQEEAGVYFGIRYQGRALDPDKWCATPAAAG